MHFAKIGLHSGCYDIFKTRIFLSPTAQDYFASMVAMYSNPGAAIDPVIIADALAKSGQYDSAGGRDYLVQLAQAVPSTANVESYAKIVKEQYYLRRLIESAQEIIEEANSGVGDTNALIDNAEQKIYDIREGKETNAPTRIGEVIINGVYDKLSKLTGEIRTIIKVYRQVSACLINTQQALINPISFLSVPVLLWVKQVLHSTLHIMFQ